MEQAARPVAIPLDENPSRLAVDGISVNKSVGARRASPSSGTTVGRASAIFTGPSMAFRRLTN
jgi:hypothetical protein